MDQEGEALAAAGYIVERFERSSDEIADRSTLGRAAVPAQLVWSQGTRRSLMRTLRVFQPAVVHVHNTFPLLSASVLYACRAENVPVVATLHNYRLVCPSGTLFRNGLVCHDCIGRFPLPGVRHGCYRNSVLATIPMAAALVAHKTAWRTMVSAYVFISQWQRDLMAADRLPAERLFVKPNFVPSSPSAAVAPRNRVVYAGRLTEEKGVRLLMEAWDRYITFADPARLELWVAGAGPLEGEVATWAALRSSVRWVGRLGQEECLTLVAGASAVVVPSQWEETFGLVAVEAMAAGVAPIASAHGSFPEIITDGVDGVLFEPGNADSLAKAIADLQAEPERHAALGRAGRDNYEKRFSAEANIEELTRIYEFAIKHQVR